MIFNFFYIKYRTRDGESTELFREQDLEQAIKLLHESSKYAVIAWGPMAQQRPVDIHEWKARLEVDDED